MAGPPLHRLCGGAALFEKCLMYRLIPCCTLCLNPPLTTMRIFHQFRCAGLAYQDIQASSPVWLLKFDIGFLD